MSRSSHNGAICSFGLLLLAGVLLSAPLAHAAFRGVSPHPLADSRPQVPSVRLPQRTSTTENRAPSGAPLVSAIGPSSGEEGGEAGGRAEADPLVSNGLGSPTCASSLAVGLDAEARRNCETSGFLAAAAPTGNYGLDVHIDTGIVPVGGSELMTIVQDLFVTPVWMGFVWLIHTLVVMLEWCFGLDLLEGARGGLGSGLARAEESFTVPLLALALSIAGVSAAQKGLLRRRIGEALGDTLLALVMIGGGLWLIADPSGTVGALSRWSDEAALGTLAVSSGTPGSPAAALGSHLGGLFADGVEAPWCYLEFGNVSWCRDPRSLDQPLKEAGQRIAAAELREAHCNPTGRACEAGESSRLSDSARLLREARTNGALFLALPPNGPARNSINESGSLLRALCGASDATNCTAPTSAEAEFRTQTGTWPRVAGLLLIAVGLVGMLLLFGHIGLRLLLAATLSLFLLLLVPGVVLAPALGERGRELFRRWATRLFGAIVAKVVYAFLLGAAFAVTSVVEDLNGLGWWAQWLLAGAFWWGAFLKRHELLAIPPAVGALDGRVAANRHSELRQTIRSARSARESIRRRVEKRAIRLAQEVAAPGAPPGLPAGSRLSPRHPPALDPQVKRMLSVERRAEGTLVRAARQDIAARAPRIARLNREHSAAVSAGDSRRAASLEARRSTLIGATAKDEPFLRNVRDSTQEQTRLAATARLLDEQAALPPARERPSRSDRRDYGALAGLANLGRAEYERLDPRTQRVARLQIDRELAARASVKRDAGAHTRSGDRDATQARPTPHASIARRRSRPPETSRPVVPRARRDLRREAEESEVMRDAREVEAGRKRQLGLGRP